MIIVKTTFDESVLKEINKEHINKTKKFMIFFIAFIALMGVIGILVEEYIPGIILLVFSIIYYPLVKFIVKISQNKIKKTMSLMSSITVETYTFDSNLIKIEINKGSDYNAIVKTNFSYLYQVIENENNFFLYISKVQMHVVPKDKIVEGSLSELRELFEENLGEKFKSNLKKIK